MKKLRSKTIINELQTKRIQQILERAKHEEGNEALQGWTVSQVIEKLIFLFALQSRKSGGGNIYAFPTHTWLADQCSRERKAAIRGCAALEDASWIRHIRRNPTAKGKWQSNLYFPGAKLWKIIMRVVKVTLEAAREIKEAIQEERLTKEQFRGAVNELIKEMG